MRRYKAALLGAVSLLAISAVSAAPVFAGDLPARATMVSKAPVPPTPSLYLWLEGGASYLSGADPYVSGFTSPGFPVGAKWLGEMAAGFDYRFDSSWHLSGQFRYGQGTKHKTHNPNATFLVPTPTAAVVAQAVSGTGSATRNESHWLADFMVGRDMNLGLGASQVKLGVRVASIRGKTTGLTVWGVPITTSATTASGAPSVAAHQVSYTQKSYFLGVGPRAALEGSIPLGGAWSFDYNLGVSALFGNRTVTQTFGVNGPNVNPCLAGCPVNLTNDDKGAVFNFDAQPGLSYAFSQKAKLTASYRFDGYWNAMRQIDANNTVVNANRMYQGAFLRFTFAGN